jgi:hypothetical protein
VNEREHLEDSGVVGRIILKGTSRTTMRGSRID